MELPGSNDLNELNRILIAVAELANKNKGCPTTSVTTLCSSLALGGRPADHEATLRLCIYAGLLSIKKRRVSLTELGLEFLNRNPDLLYEITASQKAFFAEQVIFMGPWQSRARDLFLSFSPNYAKVTYELSLIERPLPLRYNSVIHLLEVLKVLERTDDRLVVVPEYVAIVNQLLSERHGISERQLDLALQANKKLGLQAEEAIVEYERKRLKMLGRVAEAELVRRVSQLNTELGYDIESFDGDRPLFDYDRFIEVKASQDTQLRFFWSANQRLVAEEKGERYWIYFVGGFRPNKAHEIMPIMIQNPIKRLQEIPQLNIEVATLLISQSDELPLKVLSQRDVRGYVL